MKSFSSTAVATDHAELLRLAQAAVAKHPQALFSDFQWFLYEAKDAVYFTAGSKLELDKEKLGTIVAQMVALAPQLSHGFVGARPGQSFPKHLLDAITDVTYVDEFDGYPDKWISKSPDIFERDDLPLFRVQSVVRKGGPDATGRASMVQVRAAHALLEGADSALLTRSQSAARGGLNDNAKKTGFLRRTWGFIHAQALAWTYIITANLFAPPEKPWGFKTLAIKRHRLRLLANRIGVRQRSLYFALVTYALNGDGPDKHLSKKVIGAAYTLLGEKTRTDQDDDFLRVRALQAKFKVSDDFIEFVRMIDDNVARLEAKDISKFMTLMGVMMKTFRNLNRVFPGLPGKRFWRFNLGIDIALTLVPPHHAYGPLTQGIVEPIYCGAWHPAQNICTYCPGREYLTLNFSMQQRLIDNVDRIMPLLERIEAMNIVSTGRKVENDDA
jgi:hypothetical protein